MMVVPFQLRNEIHFHNNISRSNIDIKNPQIDLGLLENRQPIS